MSCYLQFSLACLVFSLSLTSTGSAQRLTAATSDRNLLPYGGILKGPDNAPIADRTVSLTFAIYEDRKASVPLWRETQSVSTDAKGNYAVVLGAPTAAGLPADLFPPGEQRWLGVQILGGLEQPRLPLAIAPNEFNANEASKQGVPPNGDSRCSPTDSGDPPDCGSKAYHIQVNSPRGNCFAGPPCPMPTRGLCNILVMGLPKKCDDACSEGTCTQGKCLGNGIKNVICGAKAIPNYKECNDAILNYFCYAAAEGDCSCACQ